LLPIAISWIVCGWLANRPISFKPQKRSADAAARCTEAVRLDDGRSRAGDLTDIDWLELARRVYNERYHGQA
jgi:hypothetical protein